MVFEGKFFNAADTKIDDRLNLETWKVFGVGPQSRKQQGATILDYGAAPATTIYKTVADVRKQLAADDYAGELDPARDFTGFWKTDCADAFGLQIKHFGTDGKYSIVFCGPGGCGDPADEGRKTFITKDPHFQVVSEDELKQQTAGRLGNLSPLHQRSASGAEVEGQGVAVHSRFAPAKVFTARPRSWRQSISRYCASFLPARASMPLSSVTSRPWLLITSPSK